MHSGAGRFTIVDMRTMSWQELEMCIRDRDTSHVVLRDSGWYHVFAFNKADCMAQDSIYLAYGKEFFNARFLLTDEGLLNQKIIVPEISWPVPDSVKWTFDH